MISYSESIPATPVSMTHVDERTAAEHACEIRYLRKLINKRMGATSQDDSAARTIEPRRQPSSSGRLTTLHGS